MNPRDESGSTLPLTMFFGSLCLLLVLLVVAATSLYVERKRLFTAADAAALAGAEAFELSDLQPAPDGSLRPRLASQNVTAAVVSYLRDDVKHDFESLRITEASTRDGTSATVTLTARWKPPVLALLVPDGMPLSATSTSRAVFQ